MGTKDTTRLDIGEAIKMTIEDNPYLIQCTCMFMNLAMPHRGQATCRLKVEFQQLNI